MADGKRLRSAKRGGKYGRVSAEDIKQQTSSSSDDTKRRNKYEPRSAGEIRKSKTQTGTSGKDAISTGKASEKEARWEFDEKDPAAIAKSVQSLVMRLKKSGALKTIKEEFMRLKKYNPEGSTKAFKENEMYNRYNEIELLDKTRVILKNRGSDYIHASRVMVGNNMFICTQGPLDSSKESFWAMVIQEKVKLIVMLCKLVEDGKEKCVEYFPRNGGTSIVGSYKINAFDRKVISDADGATCGRLDVLFEGKTHTVEHIWYENWADHTAPENFKATVELIRLARKKRQNAPVIVHCSAGVGRSGCFVAIEMAAHIAATTSCFSMEMVLKAIRDQRMHSIQNDMQYLYVYRGFVEYLIDRGVIKRLDVLKFINDYDNLMRRKRRKDVDESKGKEPKEEQKAKAKDEEYTPSVYFNVDYKYFY
uniref:Protein-tyrosine phosphatase n=1 Tax=Haemonchus contortus TaxID=6289 RepID=A0A7I4YKB9_HAECO